MKHKVMLILVLVLCIASCADTGDQKEIKEVIDGFYGAMAAGNFEKAGRYVSVADRKYFKEINDSEKDIAGEYFMRFLSKSKWKIADIEENNDESTALVTVQLEVPNIGEILGRICAARITSPNLAESFQNEVNADYYKKAISDIESGNFSYANIAQKVLLIHEKGKWKLLLNIKQQGEVNRLRMEGWQLYKKGKIEEARGKFKDALSIKDDELSKYILEKIDREAGEN